MDKPYFYNRVCLFIFIFFYMYVIVKITKRPEVGIMITYIPIYISAVSLLLAIYTYLSKSNKDNTTELTTVIVKLENIGNGISDIKSEIASLKNDQKDDHDRLIRVEESLASAWKRINEISMGGIVHE